VATGISREIDDTTDRMHVTTTVATFPASGQAKTARSTLAQTALDQQVNWRVQQATNDLPTPPRHGRSASRCGTGQQAKVRVCPNDVPSQVSLFVIPIIVRFEDTVPESHFEKALHQVTWDSTAKLRFGLHYLGSGGVTVWPGFYWFDDLRDFPQSYVLKRLQSLAGFGIAPSDRNQLFPPKNRSLKRSTAFLRYLVGQCHRPLYEPEAPTTRSCEGLGQAIKAHIEQYIGRSCKVLAFYTGSFIQPLYTGVWRYQSIRLEDIVRSMSVDNHYANKIEATIAAIALQDEQHIRVSFSIDGNPLGGRAYLLETRPGENLRRCVRRVGELLEAEGLFASVKDGVAESAGKYLCSQDERSVIDLRI